MDVIPSTLKMEAHSSPKWAMSTFKLSRCQDTEKFRLHPQIIFVLKFLFFYIRPNFFQITAGILPKITTNPFFFLGPYPIYYLLITQIIRSSAIWIPESDINWTTHKHKIFSSYSKESLLCFSYISYVSHSPSCEPALRSRSLKGFCKQD